MTRCAIVDFSTLPTYFFGTYQVCGVHPGRVLELRTNLALMRAKAILEQQQQQREDDEEEDQKTRGRLKSARCVRIRLQFSSSY